jgi:AcrR family transcriptional regulator
MGKSLTEVAKAILMNESNDSAPDAGAKSSNPNMATLKPGGGSKGGVEPSPMSNDATMVADAPKKPGEGDNVGAKAATMKQDTSQASPSRKGAVPAMPAQKEVMEEDLELEDEVLEEAKEEKKEKEEEEEMDESVEMTEELQAFIDQMIEEGYDEDQIVAAIEENFEFVSEETEVPVEYDYEVDMNEDVEALFAGEELSEEFKQKAITIFEAAVKAKMQSEIARLEEAYADTLEEEVQTIKEELSSNVDDYLNYVVEQWVSDNEVAIEAGLRTELTEDFISGLRQLFAENYIDIPEDKISVVEELGNKVEELESKLNEEIERNVELTKVLSESMKTEVMHSMTEGLTATQAEKLKQLAENVDFVDADSYATKIQTLRESYFPSSVKAQSELDKIESGTEGQTMIAEENNPMSKYVRALGKSLPN